MAQLTNQRIQNRHHIFAIDVVITQAQQAFHFDRQAGNFREADGCAAASQRVRLLFCKLKRRNIALLGKFPCVVKSLPLRVEGLRILFAQVVESITDVFPNFVRGTDTCPYFGQAACELEWIKRFREHLKRTQVLQVDNFSGLYLGCHEHHRRCRQVWQQPQPRQRSGSVHAWHHHIEQNQIRMKLRRVT